MTEPSKETLAPSYGYFLVVCACAVAAGGLALLLQDRPVAVAAIVLGLYALHLASLMQTWRLALRSAPQEPARAAADPLPAGSARIRGSGGRAAATHGAGRRGVPARPHPAAGEPSPAARRSAESRAWWRTEVGTPAS